MTGMLVTAVVLLAALAFVVTARTLTASLDNTLIQEAKAYSAAMQGAPPGDALGEATRAYLSARTGGESGGLSPILFTYFQSGRLISNSEMQIELSLGLESSSTAGPFFRSVEHQGQRYRALVTPVISREGRSGVFVAALSQEPAQQTARRVALTLIAAGLVALAIMLPLSYFATRAALSPLRRMALDAESVSYASPGRRIEYAGPDDELGSLADSLNAMLARLEHAFDNQRRFVADASHELRTPVAVIRGNVELLRTGRSTGASADESLEMIESESVRMGRLIDELLALAQLENVSSPSFQPLAINTLVEEVTARTRLLGDRDVVMRCGPETAWVLGDPDHLERALLNLAKNAVAHTHEGGRIALECSASPTTVTVSVTDDGPGIDARDLERVFDRFFRSPESRRDVHTGGAGLGLAIVKRLVELHDGSVSAENVEPHGARFTLKLPRIDAPDDAASREHDSDLR